MVRVIALTVAWFGAGLVAIYLATLYLAWLDPDPQSPEAIGVLIVSWFVIGMAATIALSLVERQLRR